MILEISILILFLIRVYAVFIPARLKPVGIRRKRPRVIKEKGRKPFIRTMIVLGSGGHTTEMLKLMRRLRSDVYGPLIYVIGATDSTSMEKVQLERQCNDGDVFVSIPRSREVGQGWISSLWSTLHATFVALHVIYTHRPQLLLCNGPGTCIPVCIAFKSLQFLGFLTTSSKLVFSESFARVNSISLTGKLLYYIADEFVVHWPQLQASYPAARYLGTIL